MTVDAPAARVKVCGLTREADVAAAVAAGADALGVIVDVPVDTPREVPAERAAALLSDVPPFVTTVLVTMAESPARIRDLHDRVGADAVQVHGDVDAESVASLAGTLDAAVVKTVHAADPDAARAYDGVADALLVDSADAAGGGGTGRTHDWKATRALASDLDSPVVLAGGLTPANVAAAVRTVEPYAVDVASGVEAEGGVKDHDAVRTFVREATRARGEVSA